MPNAPVFAKLRGRPRKSSFSKASTLVIKNIAKKAVMTIAETKSAYANSAHSLVDDVLYGTNLNYFLTQNNTSESIVGEKFFLKNIYLKGEIFGFNNATVGNDPTALRMMIIRTKKALTNTTTSLTIADVIRGTNTRIASTGFVDMHKVDLLYDKVHWFEGPNQANTSQWKPFTINLKINKTHFVDADGGGYLKDKNYYLITTAHKGTVVGANVGYIRLQWALNFKDV